MTFARNNIKPIGWLQLLSLVALGGIAFLLPITISVLWLGVIALTLAGYVYDRPQYIWYGISLSPVMEVWSRMSKAPGVPFEIGKYYLLIAIAILLLYHVRRRSDKPVHHAGKAIALLLLPSILVAISVFDREQWVFNILSMMELALLLIFAARERWDVNRFCETLRMGILAIIPFLVYVTLRSPGVGDMSFVVGVNVEASGGFGSNQVSTILGVGIVLTSLLLMIRYPLFAYRWMSVVFIGYLALRGLLTFSRGGMLGALVAVSMAVVPFMFTGIRSFFRYTLVILGLVGVGWGMFGMVNKLTGDKLLQRYKGETQGTLSGNRKKTLNVATSGRSELILADMQIFGNNPFFGVGPGEAKSMRTKYGGVEDSAAHTEPTRLLSEHGIGGLLAALVFLLFPLGWVWKQKMRVWQGMITGLFTLAVFTSMHSAMRTNLTVVYYVLAAMPVVVNSYWLSRFKRL